MTSTSCPDPVKRPRNRDRNRDRNRNRTDRKSPWQKASLHLPRGRKVVNPVQQVQQEAPPPPAVPGSDKAAGTANHHTAATSIKSTSTSTSTSTSICTSTSTSASTSASTPAYAPNCCSYSSYSSYSHQEEPEASPRPTSLRQTSLRQTSPRPTSPLHPRLQKSNTWNARASSLMPALTMDTADSSPSQPPVQRKPVGVMMSPPQTPPPRPCAASQVNVDFSSPRSAPLTLDALQHNLPLLQEQEQQRQRQEQEHEREQEQEESPRAQSGADPPVSVSQSDAQEIPEFTFSLSTHQPPEMPADTDIESTHRRGKLHKEQRQSRPRTSSLSQPKLTDSQPSLLAQNQQSPPDAESRGRGSISAQPSLAPSASTPNVRSASSHNGSQSPTRGRLRLSWLPGGARSRSSSINVGQQGKYEAWLMSDDAQPEYNPAFLKNAEKVPELWNENGNIHVYLYPRGTGCGPSFKVPEFVVGTSYVFNELIHSQTEEDAASQDRTTSFGGRDNLTVQDAARVASSPTAPTGHAAMDDPSALRLYLPAAPPTASAHLSAPGEGAQAELDRLIAIRNLFAFLTGQPLVGTKHRPTMFHAFVEIAGLLQEFGFSSPDGSNFGEAVELSFGFYSEQLALSDCRLSREKTVEGLVLGERMRCADLYNEAFAHAAGKYSAILDLNLPLYEQVSAVTRQRLERAHLDLVNRQHNVNEHLEQFEFPSMFSGIANSTSIPELRQVHFKTWRNSFGRMRQFILGYYKSTFGSWPPKASNKKNPFAESGLNRLVLKMLYSDMCALYDLLVDRTNLTCRVMDEAPSISDASSKMATSALRNMLSEFDRSKPPVLPPIPFDLPQLPSMKAIHETFDSMTVKDQNRMEKKIKEHELILILNKAYNYDTNRIKLPFLDQFKEFEIREGRGKVTQDLVDQRIGYWLFLYAVLQSLPMLVVDAPGVKYTEGVEYFLCEPPMGNLPWVEDRQVRKMWYEVTGGGGLVELSADAVMFSVEATYHRSHCWLAAKQWEGLDGAEAPLPEETPMSPLQPPTPLFPGEEPSLGTLSLGGPGTPSPPPGGPQPALRPTPRNLSPAQRSRYLSRSSIAIGLEPVPLEPPNVFASHNRSSSIGPRPPSSHLGFRSSSVGNLVGMVPPRVSSPAPMAKPAATSGATFDDILGESASQKKPAATKKKGRFF